VGAALVISQAVGPAQEEENPTVDQQNMHARNGQQVNRAGLLKSKFGSSVQTGFPAQKQSLG
jgi:hypothetical protein